MLRDLIPAAKNLYRNPGRAPFLRRGVDALTADTPVPYRMADLIKQIDERIGLLESKNDRPVLRSLKTRIESARRRPALPLHVQLAADRGHDPRDDRQHLPRAAWRQAGHLLRDGRHAFRGRQLGLLRACPPCLRPRAVERGQPAAAGAVRGGAPLHAGRPQARLRADPARALAHRQGGPQIWLLPRRRDAAAGRARSDDPVAMLDLLRHAACQRAGPGDHPLGDRRIRPPRRCRSCPRWASARRSPSARASPPPCA